MAGQSGQRMLTLRDFIDVSLEVFAPVPRDALITESVLNAAKLALDAASAMGPDGEFVYPTLPERAGVLVRILLQKPPFGADGGKVAWAQLEALLGSNGARWPHAPTVTVLEFDRAVRVPRLARQMGEWVAGDTELSRNSIPSSEKVDVNSLVVRVATPLARTGPNRNALLAGLDADVRRASDEVRAIAWSGATDLLVEIPSLHMQTLDPELANSGLVRELNHGVVSRAAGLILADLDGCAVSFGAACEWSWFRQHDGPVLYLADEQASGRSRLLPALAQDGTIDMVWCSGREARRNAIAAWMVKRGRQIEAAERRHGDRQLQLEPLRRRLADRWRRQSRRRQAVIAGMVNMAPSELEFLMTESAGLAVAPLHLVLDLARSLNVRIDVPLPDRGVDQAADDVNWAALIQLQLVDRLDLDTVARLRDRAISVAAGDGRGKAYRRRLASLSDWRSLLDELDR